jgi:sulfatase-like protein
MTRRVVVSAWLGFALAGLFFYPLAVALDADIYYLQWQTRDIAETVAAIGALAALYGVIVFATWWRPTRAATLVLILTALLPLASLIAGVTRQLPYDDELRIAWENRALRLSVPFLLAAALCLGFVRYPSAFGRWVRRAVVLVSPISLVVVGTLVASASRVSAVTEFDRGTTAQSATSSCATVVALLFDELSFSYLYDDDGNVRPEFPEFARFSSTATNYRSVAAPGKDTLVAVPSMLAARHVKDIRTDKAGLMEVVEGKLSPFAAARPDGLFSTAQALGFRTEVAGYYLAYCALLRDVVDACHSLSFYNVSSARRAFSPISPGLTTLILWPRQFPFGLLKNPPFARHQRDLVASLTDFATRPMQNDRPLFRFVHFSVPHLPFVFGDNGYDPPFDPLRTVPDTEYVNQLHYVDQLLGDLLAPLRRSGRYETASIAVFADHGYRFGGRERDPLHVPFLVKTPHQDRRVDITAAQAGERLLKDVVRQACATG